MRPEVMTTWINRPAQTGFAWAILESLPDAMIATDTGGAVRCINLAAQRLLGCTPDEACGRPLAEVLTVVDSVGQVPSAAPLVRLVSTDGQPPVRDYPILVRRDGSRIPIAHAASTIRGPDGGAVGLLIVLRDARRTRDLIRRLTMRATHDRLTRLVNRAEFERRLARLLAGQLEGQSHALLFMDLDGFRVINDTGGHAAGDAVLRQVADLLRCLARRHDTLARLGGDEFGLLLEHCPAEQARERADDIGRLLRRHDFRWQARNYRLSVSIGLAPITGRTRSLRELLADADRACCAAKRRGAVGP